MSRFETFEAVAGKGMGALFDEVRVSSATAHLVPVSDKTAWVFLEIALMDGSRGFGEATSFGQEAALLTEIDGLNSLIQSDPRPSVGAALDLLNQAHMSDARRTVQNAFEQALFDAIARRQNAPLTLLLGGPYRTEVSCYANINRGVADRGPEGFARQAAQIARAGGYTAIKIAPFDGLRWTAGTAAEQRRLFAVGIARIDAVRSAVGADVEVLIDCHGRLNVAMATQLMREIAAFDVYWVEEPVDMAVVPVESQRALRGAAHAAGTRIAGGEALRSLRQAVTLFQDGGHDVILPDLRLTGLTCGIAMLAAATEFGVAASLHNPVGPVLDAVSRHAAAACPSFLILERQVAETPLFDALRGEPAVVREGAVALDRDAGFGFVPDAETLAAAAAEPFRQPSSLRHLAGAGPDA